MSGTLSSSLCSSSSASTKELDQPQDAAATNEMMDTDQYFHDYSLPTGHIRLKPSMFSSSSTILEAFRSLDKNVDLMSFSELFKEVLDAISIFSSDIARLVSSYYSHFSTNQDHPFFITHRHTYENVDMSLTEEESEKENSDYFVRSEKLVVDQGRVLFSVSVNSFRNAFLHFALTHRNVENEHGSTIQRLDDSTLPVIETYSNTVRTQSLYLTTSYSGNQGQFWMNATEWARFGSLNKQKVHQLGFNPATTCILKYNHRNNYLLSHASVTTPCATYAVPRTQFDSYRDQLIPRDSTSSFLFSWMDPGSIYFAIVSHPTASASVSSSSSSSSSVDEVDTRLLKVYLLVRPKMHENGIAMEDLHQVCLSGNKEWIFAPSHIGRTIFLRIGQRKLNQRTGVDVFEFRDPLSILYIDTRGENWIPAKHPHVPLSRQQNNVIHSIEPVANFDGSRLWLLIKTNSSANDNNFFVLRLSFSKLRDKWVTEKAAIKAFTSQFDLSLFWPVGMTSDQHSLFLLNFNTQSTLAFPLHSSVYYGKIAQFDAGKKRKFSSSTFSLPVPKAAKVSK